MKIGVVKEIKDKEYRIAVPPNMVAGLVQAGHQVVVESTAGEGSGFIDDEFKQAGAQIVDVSKAWGSDMVVKVKEPLPSEYHFLRKDLILFTYFHLAASEELTRAVIDKGIIGIAYETVELPNGSLPLLTPMSEVAGRMAVQEGAYYLKKTAGGSGKLLGGVPGTPPCNVVIIGGGVVGTNAAEMALGMGAHVTIVTRNVNRLRYLGEVLHGNLETRVENSSSIAESVKDADLLIGAVLIPGGKAPKLITRAMIKTMKPGSVIVDVAIDQGGCMETSRATSYSDPTYVVDGIIHYCVANVPGAVPRTSAIALSNATYPYALKLANLGVDKAVSTDSALAKGVNVYKGKLVHQDIAETFGLEFTPLEKLLK